MSTHSFKRKEVSRLKVCFPNLTRDSVAAAVESFADVVDFKADAANAHVGTVTLEFRRPVTLEEGALHFGGTRGSFVILERKDVQPGVNEHEPPQ